ncbi:LysR family transcriptional regulator [Nocardia cyriacigeorgica]|uniref:LysR family transcriptional regulator n=1 Tax=Nocardia cyriacigeorgica TaxID=135487 RepID=A0A6P1CP73_9NOCA|nr:LysR family transcriptional regulator [Nocardia cyriacigeorgica]NEW34371.1 LysR family transcriptional regulator [Nocardia cyriacigeorgica]
MLDVRKLRLLRELAHRQTIAAVAEAMNYTPSAVSQQLSALEREAGVPLLERTGRRVTLTPAALTLVDHTETILATLERAAADLTRATEHLAGTLRIGAFPSAVPTILTPALIALTGQHPGLEVVVTELDPATAPAALRTEAVDVALVQEYDHVPVPPDPALDTDPLLAETIYLAALDDDPLPQHRDAPWIAGTPGTLCHAMTIRVCEAAGFTPRIRHHVDDFSAVLALVAVGRGVSLVPELGARTPPGNVVLSPLPTRRHTRLAYRRGTRAHPIVSAARAALHDCATSQFPQALP